MRTTKKDVLRLEVLLRVPGLIILVVLLLVRAAYGQNWVEERTYVAGGMATPRIDGLLATPIKSQMGGFIWFQVQQGYSQAYGGLTYAPKSWLQVALGGGLEQDKHPARIGSYVWMGKAKISGLAVFEDGGSGFWYKVESNYQATPKLGIGMLSERYHGSGPKIEFSVPHTALKLWCAPLASGTSLRPVFGVRWSLK